MRQNLHIENLQGMHILNGNQIVIDREDNFCLGGDAIVGSMS